MRSVLQDLYTTHSRRTAQTEAIPTCHRFVRMGTWPSGQVAPKGHGFLPGASCFTTASPHGVEMCGCPLGQQTNVVLHGGLKRSVLSDGPSSAAKSCVETGGSLFVLLAGSSSVFLGNRYFTFHGNSIIMLPEILPEDTGAGKTSFRNRRSPSLEHRTLAHEVRASWRLSSPGL